MFQKGISGNPNGRPKKGEFVGNTRAIIEKGAPSAARYLAMVANAEAKGSIGRIEAAKFLVNHAIGMPKQRGETSGELIIHIKYDDACTEVPGTGEPPKELTPGLPL